MIMLYCRTVCTARGPLKFLQKNIIRDGGSTALLTACTVDMAYTVDTVYTVYIVDTVYTIETALHC